MGVRDCGFPSGTPRVCLQRSERKPTAKGMLGPSKAPAVLLLGETGIVASPGVGTLP